MCFIEVDQNHSFDYVSMETEYRQISNVSRTLVDT